MKTIMKCLAVGIIAQGGALCAAAQPSADGNAALRYWRAFALLSESDNETISTLTKANAKGGAWLEEEPNTAWLDERGETIALLADASSMAEADFGIDYDKGIEALLTHLAPMRQAARLTLLRAEADLAAGDTERAVAHAASALRMSQHLTDDRVIISALVSASIFDASAGFIVDAMDDGVLAKADLTPVREALARFDRADPFGSREAVISERDIFGDWVHRKLNDLDEEARADLFATLYGQTPGNLSKECRAMMEKLDTPEEIDEQMLAYKLFFTQAVEAWDEPDAAERLDDLAEGVKQGVFGDVAQYLAPSLTHVQGQDLKARERFGEIERLIAAQ